MNEQDIIKVLTNRRIQLGLSQKDLENLTGIKQPAIARMENFKAIPNLKTLIVIADALRLKFEVTYKDVRELY